MLAHIGYFVYKIQIDYWRFFQIHFFSFILYVMFRVTA